MKNILKSGLALAVAAVVLTACSDWTDPEPVGVKYETAGEAQPETYAKYLANLRAYRDNGHKKAYAWFENKATFTSQAHHISAVPDSIDVLVLSHPEIVNDLTLNEMVEKRSNTGMQMAYSVSYTDIKAAWTAKKELETADKPVAAWNTFMVDSLGQSLKYAGLYGFNRVILSYDGQSTAHMTAAERTEYAAEQAALLAPVKQLMDGGNVAVDLIGMPANILDNDFLQKAGVIFLSQTASAGGISDLDFDLAQAGVAPGKIGAMSALPVNDPNFPNVGHWATGYAACRTAQWVRSTDGVVALGMTNLADGYYNPDFIYPVCRMAMQVLNPAAK